jgi:hypothetical protein
MPIKDLAAVWDDVPARRALLAGDGLPTRQGAIATFEPVVQDNQLYNIDLQLIFYDEPLFGSYEGWYRQIVRDRRYVDEASNLRYFDGIYAQIDAERRPVSWWVANRPELAGNVDFPAFYERYYQQVAREAAVIAGAPRRPAYQVRR